MLFPQTNRCRTIQDLNGFWQFRTDADDTGRKKNWHKGFDNGITVGVPASWNEQLAETGLMDYVGSVWYQRSFYIARHLQGKKIILRFDSADFSAEVWLNGKRVGTHQGGFLPFEFDISSLVDFEQSNLLVVCVDNRLNHDTIPQGISEKDYNEFGRPRDLSYPSTIFDFMAYGGLNRPVRLIYLSNYYIKDIKIETKISGTTGIVNYNTLFSQKLSGREVVISLFDGKECVASTSFKQDDKIIEGSFEIDNCRFWSPEDPKLYSIEIELFDNDEALDEYHLEIGVREISITEEQLLLNGKPIFLKGFGKHEDFPVLGKGLSYALIVKDFQLMKWLGANSFRTSHYPYSEELMQIADRLGFLVIDEVPAVSLNFRYVTDKTLENHKNSLNEMIARDRNHPSVIAWSIANEPGIWGEEEAASEKAKQYWSEIYNYTKKLDSSRPLTLPACAYWKENDISYQYSDFISINRYWGWYEIPGDIKKAGRKLKEELQLLFRLNHKPILVSEFGADTVEGMHSTYPQMFTEEYQSDLIEEYFKIIRLFPFTIGEHIWNFADFRTAQHHRRVVFNKKGVFTRQREPKSAAFMIKKFWAEN